VSHSKLRDRKSIVLSIPLIAQLVSGETTRDFIITAGSNLSIAVFSAIGGILAARLLGPEGRGELAAATVWAGVLGTVATLGLPQALTYFAARDSSAIGSIFMTAMVLWAAQSIGILLFGWLAITFLLTHFQPGAVDTVRIYLFSIPCSLLTTYLSTIAQGLKRFKLFNALRVASALGYVLSLITAGILGSPQAQVVVALMLAFQIVSALAALIFFVLRIHPKGGYDGRQTRQVLGYGLKSYWGSLSWMANARLDQFIMSAFVGLEALGHYAVAVSYATVLFPLSGAFAMVLFPRVAEDNGSAAVNKIKRTLKLNLAVTGSGAVLLGVLCPLILPWLFGGEFQPAIQPATILLGGTVLLGCNYVLSDGLRGLGHPLMPSIAETIGVVVVIAGLSTLLPRYGILAAAWVSLSSYAIVGLVLVISFRQRGNTAFYMIMGK